MSAALAHPVRSGAVAGAISALAFALVHDLFISDIWTTAPIMMAAGALCGMTLSRSYDRLFARPRLRGWVGWNVAHVAMFGLLGLVSVLVFEPVTTMAALIVANEPPDALIRQAMPVTIAFTVATSLLLWAVFSSRPSDLVPVLVSTTTLVLLLGLNVSVIGLVEIPRGSTFVVVELFGLIVALGGVYCLAFAAIEGLLTATGTTPASSTPHGPSKVNEGADS